MRSGRRVFYGLLCLCLVSVLVSGCWDRRELEERTSVVALAIDMLEKPGYQEPLFRVSVQIPIPIRIAGAGGGGSGEGGKNAVKVMSATGYSMADAIHNLQSRLNQELFYGHTRVVAVSEKVARAGMSGIIDALRRNPQMRRLLWLVITKDDAINLLRADPKLEQIPTVYVMDMFENGAKSGRLPDITLGKWYIDRSSTGIEPTANFVSTTPNEIKWNGLALFRNDKMVGDIDENESWVLVQVKDKKIGGNVTIPCPTSKGPTEKPGANYLTAHPKKIHVKTQIVPYQNTYRMTVNIMVEVDIIESMCELDFLQPKYYTQVEQAFETEWDKRAKKLVEDSQHRFQVDVFGMGNKVRAKYLSDFERMNWAQEFPKTKIDIHYQVKIRRVGMKMQ